jgi:hypothetical protein
VFLPSVPPYGDSKLGEAESAPPLGAASTG